MRSKDWKSALKQKESHNLYANLKKKVLSDCLKVATEAHFLISRGKSFHNLGPAIEKALSPYGFNLLLGTTKYFLHEERNDLEYVLNSKGQKYKKVQGHEGPCIPIKGL